MKLTQIFINECSLQGQFQTAGLFEQSVKEFVAIFNAIKKTEKLNKELYKNEIFMEHRAIKNESFLKSLNQLKDQSLKQLFLGIIFSRDNPINWCNQRLHQETDAYNLIETSENVTNTSIAEVAERKLQKNENLFLLINFISSSFKTSHQKYLLCQVIVVSKNQQLHIELDCLDNKHSFQQWVQDKLDFRNFLEKNSDNYQKTKNVVQGQAVYVEIETGYYWYLDNLHKNHFEVFNKLGTHLGEANLEGILDESKKDKGKKYS